MVVQVRTQVRTMLSVRQHRFTSEVEVRSTVVQGLVYELLIASTHNTTQVEIHSGQVS